MTANQIETTIRDNIKGGRLMLDKSLFPELEGLLASISLTQLSVLVQNVTATGSAVEVAGSCTLPGIGSPAPVSITFTADTNPLNISLVATLPAGWKFSTSFANLPPSIKPVSTPTPGFSYQPALTDDLTFQNARLVVRNFIRPEEWYFRTGLNFTGIPENFNQITPLAATHPVPASTTLAGSITLHATTAPALDLWLLTDARIDEGPLHIGSMKQRIRTVALPEVELAETRLEAVGAITIGEGESAIHFEVFTPLYLNNPVLHFYGFSPDKSATLNKGLKTLESFLGLQSGDLSLPADLGVLDRMYLQHFVCTYYTDSRLLQLLGVAVDLPLNWEILPDRITLTDIIAEFNVLYPLEPSLRNIGTSLKGVFTLATDPPVHFDVVVAYTGKISLSAGLREGETLPLFQAINVLTGLHLDVPDHLNIERLAVFSVPADRQFRFQFSVSNTWALVPGIDFTLKRLYFELNYTGGSVSSTTGRLCCSFELGETTIDASAPVPENTPPWHFGVEVSAELPQADAGWTFTGKAWNIQIGHALQKFVGNVDLPKALKSFTATEVLVSFNTASKNFHFEFQGDITDPLAVRMTVKLDLKHRTDGGYDKFFSGQVKIGAGVDERIFDVVFDDKNQVSHLLGLYRKPGGENIPLGPMLQALFGETVQVPDLDFKIKDAMFVLMTENGVKKYLFTSDMDFGIDLSGLGNLPLIGRALPAGESLRLAFQPIYSPSDIQKRLTTDDIKGIKAIVPEGGPYLPESLPGGFELLTTLHIGDQTRQIGLGIGAAQAGSQLGGSIPPPAGSPQPPPVTLPADPANTQWIDLQKNFGPLHLARIGLGYQDGKIAAVLDGSFTMGPLELALLGLGARYDLSSKELSFALDGVGLEFRQGSMELSGMFLRMGSDFAGRASLRMGSFGLTALGAYGEYKGEASLFLYAFLDFPLGGPVFFFVEGLALGFGYNRKFIVPPIEQIHTFPLIAEATGTAQPDPGLKKTGPEFATAIRREFALLEQYLPPELGRYFLAAGVKFNSFRIIDSFALLSVSFGQSLSFALLGVSKLSIPDASGRGNTPKVAEIELAFSVVVDPEEGFFGARAALTPNSYLFSNLCRLQGGFAFFSWFKGEHAGDFVVTIGGYHPHFTVPAHYPQPASVPRLGFSWRLNDRIFLKGEAYYALTPKAMMLGGRLEARFGLDTSVFAVNAWFILAADFLVYWKPFHYEATAMVEMGAEFLLHTLFGDIQIGMNVGADVEIWGPEFAGLAHVRAKVLFVKVEFDVSLGSGARKPLPKIPWSEFKTSFLPANPAQTGLSLNIEGGLLRSMQEAGGDRWVVSPKTFSLSVTSVAPLTQQPAYYTGNDKTGQWNPEQSAGISGLTTPTAIGIDPMGLAVFNSRMVVRVLRDGELLSQNTFTDDFAVHPLVKPYPRALWTEQLSTGKTPDINGTQMTAGTAGYSIGPGQPAKPAESHIFPVKNLEFDLSSRNMPANPATPPSFAPTPESLTFGAAYASADARAKRESLLREMGFNPAVETSLGEGLPDSCIEAPALVLQP